MSWYKKLNGRYQVRWRDCDGVNRARTVSTEREARLLHEATRRVRAPTTMADRSLKMRLKKIGADWHEFERRRTAQDGKCAICKRRSTGRALAADHCHDTGQLRSLLCTSCNVGLGSFKDSPELLRAGAEYLEGWRREHREAA